MLRKGKTLPAPLVKIHIQFINLLDKYTSLSLSSAITWQLTRGNTNIIPQQLARGRVTLVIGYELHIIENPTVTVKYIEQQ